MNTVFWHDEKSRFVFKYSIIVEKYSSKRRFLGQGVDTVREHQNLCLDEPGSGFHGTEFVAGAKTHFRKVEVL